MPLGDSIGGWCLFQAIKADSTLESSQAVPHPSTNRALCRLTSEVGRDPVHSTRYGRRRRVSALNRSIFKFGWPASTHSLSLPGSKTRFSDRTENGANFYLGFLGAKKKKNNFR